MLRRLLPTVIALVLGLAGLAWGLGYLQRIFAAERDDAQASLDSRRTALEQYARASLTQSLHDRLEAARPALEAAYPDMAFTWLAIDGADDAVLVLSRSQLPARRARP